MRKPRLPAPSAPNSGASAGTSYNWAGYVASGGGFTSLSGSWTVPQVSAGGNFSGNATWIGIGGVNANDLIQVGTQAVTQGSTTTYQAWYETLPSLSQNMPITINPGDFITASLAESAAGQWTIFLRDNTDNQSFQTVVPYNSSSSSAEWIEEMPSQGNGAFIPLDNFGSVQFYNAATVKNGQSLILSQTGAMPMTMINALNQALATPSAIGSDGQSFTITRTAAAPSSSVTPFGRRGQSRVGVGVNGFAPGQRNWHERGFSRMNLRFFTRFSFER